MLPMLRRRRFYRTKRPHHGRRSTLTPHQSRVTYLLHPRRLHRLSGISNNRIKQPSGVIAPQREINLRPVNKDTRDELLRHLEMHNLQQTYRPDGFVKSKSRLGWFETTLDRTLELVQPSLGDVDVRTEVILEGDLKVHAL